MEGTAPAAAADQQLLDKQLEPGLQQQRQQQLWLPLGAPKGEELKPRALESELSAVEQGKLEAAAQRQEARETRLEPEPPLMPAAE